MYKKHMHLRIATFIFSLLTFFATGLSAQNYNTAAGLRLGKYVGLSVSQRVMPHVTIEGLYQSSLGGNFQYLTGMARKHGGLFSRRLNYYWGGGAHIGWGESLGATRGFDAVVGVELTLFRFNVSMDYKPSINIATEGGKIFQNQGGLTVRYVLLQKKNNPRMQARQKESTQSKRFKKKSKRYRDNSIEREEKGKKPGKVLPY